MVRLCHTTVMAVTVRFESPIGTQERDCGEERGRCGGHGSTLTTTSSHHSAKHSGEPATNPAGAPGFHPVMGAQGPSFASWESDHRSGNEVVAVLDEDHAQKRPMP